MSAFPTSPIPQSLSIRSFMPTRVSIAHSGKRNTRSRAAQRYSLTIGWHDQTRNDMAPIAAFVESLRGQYANCTFSAPLLTTPLGTWAGDPVVDGAGQVGYAINLRGLTPGATAKANDLLQFAGDVKVYKVASDATANGSGLMTIALVQALMASPADGAAVSTAPVFTVAATSDLFEVAAKPGDFYDFQLELVEDV